MGDEREFQQAIERYTEAITLNRNNHLLFSDRSAAYARVGRFAEALEDANRCHELKPDWPKVSKSMQSTSKAPSSVGGWAWHCTACIQKLMGYIIHTSPLPTS